MTVSPVPGGLLLSPLSDSLLRVPRKRNVVLESKPARPLTSRQQRSPMLQAAMGDKNLPKGKKMKLTCNVEAVREKRVSNECPSSTKGVSPGKDLPSAAPDLSDEIWVLCDICEKWRLLPYGRNKEELPEYWLCKMIDWLPGMNSCDFSEEETTNALRALYQPPPESQGNLSSDPMLSQGKKKQLKQIPTKATSCDPVRTSNSRQEVVKSRSLNDMNHKEKLLSGGAFKENKLNSKRVPDEYDYDARKKVNFEHGAICKSSLCRSTGLQTRESGKRKQPVRSSNLSVNSRQEVVKSISLQNLKHREKLLKGGDFKENKLKKKRESDPYEDEAKKRVKFEHAPLGRLYLSQSTSLSTRVPGKTQPDVPGAVTDSGSPGMKTGDDDREIIAKKRKLKYWQDCLKEVRSEGESKKQKKSCVPLTTKEKSRAITEYRSNKTNTVKKDQQLRIRDADFLKKASGPSKILTLQHKSGKGSSTQSKDKDRSSGNISQSVTVKIPDPFRVHELNLKKIPRDDPKIDRQQLVPHHEEVTGFKGPRTWASNRSRENLAKSSDNNGVHVKSADVCSADRKPTKDFVGEILNKKDSTQEESRSGKSHVSSRQIMKQPGTVNHQNGANDCLGKYSPKGCVVKDLSGSSLVKRDASTSNSFLKEAEQLKASANRMKETGFESECNEAYFQAALKYLLAASLQDQCDSGSNKHAEVAHMQIYRNAAKLFETCAQEYEKHQEMAAASLGYKCMQIAYMRLVYCKSLISNRDRLDLQSSLQTVCQGESLAGPRVTEAQNRLDFISDANFAMEATRKALKAFAAAAIILEEAQNKEGIVSLRRVMDFSFYDLEEFVRLVQRFQSEQK